MTINRFRWQYWVIPLILLIAGTAGVRSGIFSTGQTKKVDAVSAMTVSVSNAGYVAKAPRLNLTGNVEGETSAVVSAKIAGRIEQVLVEDGQKVDSGQALVRLESMELANSVRINEEAVARAQANYENTLADTKRFQTLFEQNAVSRQQLDSMDTKLKVAQADLDSARAALDNARRQFDYAVVTAPVGGVVAGKAATIGQVITAGTPLLTVENIEQVYVTVNVEQKYMGVLKTGLPAEITVDAYPGFRFAGKVEIINPAAVTANRMYRTKIKLDNADHRLKPGMFVKATLLIGQETQVLAVPLSAMLQKQGIYYVFVPQGDKVARQQVEIGEVLGDKIEIKSGLEQGATVITSNVTKLKDGDSVIIAR